MYECVSDNICVNVYDLKVNEEYVSELLGACVNECLKEKMNEGGMNGREMDRGIDR